MDHNTEKSVVPIESISQKILLIRGMKVMLDSDLAELYEVSTKRLNEQVKRNHKRFPTDFMFRLTAEEYKILRSHFATSKKVSYRRYRPLVFTEHGVAMLSSVLNNHKAVETNIIIIRAFIKLREVLASNLELKYKIEALEDGQKVQNRHINKIYILLEKLISEPVKTKNQIGFNKP